MFLQLQIFIYLGEIVDEKEGEKRNKSSVFVYQSAYYDVQLAR